jgi:hypothetical protein
MGCDYGRMCEPLPAAWNWYDFRPDATSPRVTLSSPTGSASLPTGVLLRSTVYTHCLVTYGPIRTLSLVVDHSTGRLWLPGFLHYSLRPLILAFLGFKILLTI